ncbi:MAG: FadR/GntR family transcriptional regulator [Lewinella sp.]|jgi:GntR family transcriptional repressor for pyruvate dehydrogenase complex|uniref:FadR/GntR family transcriptional regulator n=1 Tax=Lewinella sp. TaxID=2004506 RepID=UPI003D6A4D37
MLENFSEIRVETPVDKIIKQIRALITSGQLASGDRLPAERKLAEKLGVSRSNVRDAIQKLEFYGILKTLPQSGTVVAGMGITALEGLITDVLKLEKSDFASLVETRVILEVSAAKIAAERRTPKDITDLKKALVAYEETIRSGALAVEEDLLFHLKIAEASKNAVLKSLMLIITPDIVNNFIQYKVCDDQSELKAYHQHEQILEHIINKDSEAAAEAMRIHLQDVTDFSKSKNILG